MARFTRIALPAASRTRKWRLFQARSDVFALQRGGKLDNDKIAGIRQARLCLSLSVIVSHIRRQTKSSLSICATWGLPAW
jgi:hypothetical protein